MAITQQEFEGLDPQRHQIIDCKGRIWRVLEISHPLVTLLSPGNSEVLARWQNGRVVDNFGIDVTINHPQAEVVALA